MYHATYTYTDDGTEGLSVELTFDVSFDVEPYDRGDYWTPPSGGGIYDVKLTLVEATFYYDGEDGHHTHPRGQLSAEFIAAEEKAMDDRLCGSGPEVDRFNDEMLAKVEDNRQDALADRADYLYQRYKDEGY